METITSVSADGRTKSAETDSTGNGVFDQSQVATTNADGSVTSIDIDYNPDGTVKDRAVVKICADGRTKISQIDSTNSGSFDLTVTQQTTLVDGSRSVVAVNTNGSTDARSYDATGNLTSETLTAPDGSTLEAELIRMGIQTWLDVHRRQQQRASGKLLRPRFGPRLVPRRQLAGG